MGYGTLCRYGQESGPGKKIVSKGLQEVKMKKNQVFTILFWVALGVFVMYSSWRFGLGSFRTPGPGLMPFLLGTLLCVVSLYFFAVSFFGKSAGKDIESKGKEGEPNHADIKKLVLVVVSLILYALVLEKLGYMIATLFLLFGLFWAAGTTRLVAAISSAATMVLTYLLFSRLGVVFPEGILKFIGP
jgi:putative tricarboxylic transport membrane protein